MSMLAPKGEGKCFYSLAIMDRFLRLTGYLTHLHLPPSDAFLALSLNKPKSLVLLIRVYQHREPIALLKRGCWVASE